MNREVGRKVVNVFQYNDRIIAFILNTKPVDTFILQGKMLISTHTDKKIEEIYE